MTTSSGLQIIDTVVGTGASPAGKTAVVHYTGWLYENGQKGKKFSSSVDLMSRSTFRSAWAVPMPVSVTERAPKRG